MNYCIYLILGKAFCIFIFFHFPDSRLSVLRGFRFYFCFLTWVKTRITPTYVLAILRDSNTILCTNSQTLYGEDLERLRRRLIETRNVRLFTFVFSVKGMISVILILVVAVYRQILSSTEQGFIGLLTGNQTFMFRGWVMQFPTLL